MNIISIRNILQLFNIPTIVIFNLIFQSDILILSLLTLVTCGLIGMSCLGMQYFLNKGQRISNNWTEGSLLIFLIIIVSVFGISIINNY